MKEKWNLKQLKTFYGQNQLQTKVMTSINVLLLKYIKDLNPETVFEFGCNQGKNLTYLEKVGINKVFGIDIANLEHPKTVFGDETSLKSFDDNCVDIAFTCSVLNHLPLDTVEKIIFDLKRITKKGVVLGEITHELDNPRWFLHDYESLGFKKIDEIMQSPNDKKYGLFYFPKEQKLKF